MTLKFSGDATCDIHYYAELEFGHAGTFFNDNNNSEGSQYFFSDYRNAIPAAQVAPGSLATSESQYGIAPRGVDRVRGGAAFAFRMGLIKTAATRQLMTPPEMQQFVDISLASALHRASRCPATPTATATTASCSTACSAATASGRTC